MECCHCGLPLGRRPVSAAVDGQPGWFCCYGCVLALQVTRARGESGAAASILIRLGLAIFCTMNVMMVSMPTYVPYVYGADAPSTTGPLFQVLRVLALMFAAPVLGLLGWPILAGAWRGMRAGAANTDALIVLGTAAAYAISVFNTIAGRGAVYFDTAAMLLVLVTLGRYLEARAKADAGTAVRATLAREPAVAMRVRDTAAGERIDSVPADSLVVGDLVRVGPGDAFPTDGQLLDGVGGVDEAALTGESHPRLKQPGSFVAGGTCSVDGLFRVRVTQPAAASAAARIAALLARARAERTPAERVADRVAAVLVPAVVAITCAAAGYWMLHAGTEQAVMVGLAVLVVACPCGLGIATPVAVWTGLVTAARRGVIVRSAAVIERAAELRHVLFDKTGTLTTRIPQLVAIEPEPGVTLSSTDLLARAAALEAGLAHPFARSIAVAVEAIAATERLPPAAVDTVRVVSGRGVCGVVAGESIAAGSVHFARSALGDARVPLHRFADAGGSVVALWTPTQLLGTLRFAEETRPDAAVAVQRLRNIGVQVGLLSGDMQARSVVPALFPPDAAVLELQPEDKVTHIREARTRPLAMVGDGVNDAPALAAADIGIAVGSATDLARMTADIAVVSDDLTRVPWLIVHARRVRRIIRQNLFWAFAYNAGAVALAAAGALNPLVASLAMLASSLVVVANARRLRTAETNDGCTTEKL